MFKRLGLAGASAAAVIVAGCGTGSGGSRMSSLPSSPVATALRPIPQAGAHLYVLNRGTNTVTVYAPPDKSVLRKISRGLTSPWQLGFDSSGNLYVANIGTFSSGPYNVTVYAPGETRPLRTISQDVNSPSALAFDGSGNLYVADLKTSSGGSDVTV